MKKILNILIIVFLLLCAVGVGLKFINPVQDKVVQVTQVPVSRITVSNIVSGQVVKSPLVVKGEARGSWYFEASFPVHLMDADGNELATAPAHAQGDWMTTNFVPFEVTLTFKKPTTSTGTLVLEKDNPSGLLQNEDAISIPVKFK